MPRRHVPDAERLAYSVDEVAARLGCSHQHIRNLVVAGSVPRLPAAIWGDRILIPRRWLEEQLEQAMQSVKGA